MASGARSTEQPARLVWQEVAPEAPPVAPEIQDAVYCPLCKAFIVGGCQTMQDMRDCRSLEDVAGAPVDLLPA